MEQFYCLKEASKQLLLAKKYDEAVSSYKEAKATLESISDEVLQDEKVDKAMEKAIISTNIGTGYFNLKQYDTAIGWYKQAQAASKTYEKSFYRLAQAQERVGDLKDALLNIKKISPSNRDADVLALEQRMMKEMTEESKLKVQVQRLLALLDPATKLKEVTVIEKDTGKRSERKVFGDEKDIEYSIVMIGKALEGGVQVPEMITSLVSISKMMRKLTIVEWSVSLSKDLFMKLVAVLSLLLEHLDNRELEKVYVALLQPEVHDEVAAFGKYMWQAFIGNEVGKELRDALTRFPAYLAQVDVWNSVSVSMKAGTDKMVPEQIEFLITVLYSKVKKISECTSTVVKQLEKAGLEEKSKVFSEFVERISRINSKHCKSFLITFFKAVKNVCGYGIYKLLFSDIAHLYRDNFSFQSILLMNSLLLSDYPSLLEEFLKTEPLFIKSIITLIQHLNFLLQQSDGNPNDQQMLFKLENTFQLLYLCLSNKQFLIKIGSTDLPFREELKKFLETSYNLHTEYPPNIAAKSLICTAVVILEVFPSSTALLDEMIPLSKIGHLLKTALSIDVTKIHIGDFVSDVLDILNYICKSENHVGRVANDTEIFKLIHSAIEKVKGNRHLVLHSAVSLAGALLNDKTKRNFEIANDKWGCDMEGFLLLEKVRDKASKEVSEMPDNSDSDSFEFI